MSEVLTGPRGERLELADDPLAAFRNRAPAVAPARLVYAAAHVAFLESYAAIPHSAARPGRPEELAEHVDWPTTRTLRQRLDAHGFAIAEAMDTAQRFALGWPTARRLIEESGALGLANGFVAGAGVDHLERVASRTALVDGVVWQAELIRANGGEVILLPLVWLAEQRASEAEYVEVYRAIIDQLDGPLYVHWLGEMFLPSLAGYFPGDSFRTILAHAPDKVRGAKLSLLDAELEVRLRRELLTRDQLLLTGDDFHFAALLRGGEAGEDAIAPVERTTTVGARTVPLGDFSHGLLGVFDGILEPASLALRFLAAGDRTTYDELMAPCELLGQQVFRAPTRFYKTGLALLAWLSGAQPNRMLANHEERERSLDELWRTVTHAAEARVLSASAEVAERWRALLTSPS